MKKSELKSLIGEAIREELTEGLPTGNKKPYTEGGYYQDLRYIQSKLLPQIKSIRSEIGEMATKISRSPHRSKMNEDAILTAQQNLLETEKVIKGIK